MVELTTVAIGLLLSLELGYFLKAALYGIGSRLFLSKVHLLKPSSLFGICTTRDIDFMWNHLNNARYFRVMDFGRVDHCVRTGLYEVLVKQKANMLVAASTIRYRKPVYLFMPYRLNTQLVYWDEKNFYYRQDFESYHDNFLRATSYVKLAIVGSNPKEILSIALSENPTEPKAPDDLLSWIQYNEQSSVNIRKSD